MKQKDKKYRIFLSHSTFDKVFFAVFRQKYRKSPPSGDFFRWVFKTNILHKDSTLCFCTPLVIRDLDVMDIDGSEHENIHLAAI